jgi:hypothetical protein
MMAFNVGDNVICQKKGGQSGNKAVSPPFPGVVREVLGGGKYNVDLKPIARTAPAAHFGSGVVSESEMTAA